MADQDHGAAPRQVAPALVVHLGDQRAGGVQHRQAAPGGVASTARETPWAEGPTGPTVSAPMACPAAVEADAAGRRLPVLDATCPRLVSKVHNEYR